MGNIDSLRDWGHAKDYVKMQWMMLQQDAPEDFVIATGQGLQYSVREFIQWAGRELGLTIDFSGKGVDEIGTISSIEGDLAPALSVGDVVVRIDPRYFRPAEVDTLLGDPTKAKEKLGWDARDYCTRNVCRDGSRRLESCKAPGALKRTSDVPSYIA